jgi:hypothetical protein
VNRQEKEVYLREYSILKAQGKPFWPYAVAKDGAMACVVLLAIIVMSIVLGAELGPKADPTTTTYTPRPEWYFFFLFELLRVIKPPSLVSLATLGIPTICMIMLFLLPFYDRGPERRPERRPIATVAGIFVIAAMGYLTYLGAAAGAPTQIEQATPERIKAQGGAVLRQYEAGKAGGRPVRVPGLPQDRRERQRGARAEPHEDRRPAPVSGDRPDADQPDGADAVVQLAPAEPAREVQRHGGVPRAAQVGASVAGAPGPGRARCPSRRCRRCSTASPPSTT